MSPRNPRWAKAKVDPASYRPPVGRSVADAAAEQDEAAGGRERRKLSTTSGGQATASIELKIPGKGRRVYAYLRYVEDGRTVNRYVGEAPGADRTERLRRGWALARSKGLLQ